MARDGYDFFFHQKYHTIFAAGRKRASRTMYALGTHEQAIGCCFPILLSFGTCVCFFRNTKSIFVPFLPLSLFRRAKYNTGGFNAIEWHVKNRKKNGNYENKYRQRKKAKSWERGPIYLFNFFSSIFFFLPNFSWRHFIFIYFFPYRSTFFRSVFPPISSIHAHPVTYLVPPIQLFYSKRM